MARVRGAKCRLCRREGIRLFLKGVRCASDKCAIEQNNAVPGQHKMRGKLSGYGLQLREKQRMKRMYGMLERQFSLFFKRAAAMKGATGDNLIQLLERRLDNVVARLHLVPSRSEARQMIYHGSIRVNGRKVDVPSYMVKPGEKISLDNSDALKKRITANLEALKDLPIPEWLSLDGKALSAQILRLPTTADAMLPLEVNLIVELYSK